MSEAYRQPVLGVIGGSGVYDIDGLEGARWQTVESPFGDVSDQILRGTLDGLEMAFLPRHGRGHVLAPSDVNYRANIDALKRAGVTEILSVSAVGSLAEDLPPGTFVIADQFIDRTFAREKSFFRQGSGRPCQHGPSGQRLAGRSRRRGSGRSGHSPSPGRHLSVHGGAAVLDPGRKQSLSAMGLPRHRHDQHARGQAGPRSRDRLLHRGHGHRFRLLAPRSRPRQRRGGGSRAAAKRR
uniref:Uncharacterized 25.8 kDa protein in petC 3'region n=1 Tax=Rhodospirillum rubrum TaxID=1085 RepID=YPE2_RHORU|nr:RecName: Full=Uncharacterized 25.8 kDa protein in petC 3'region [Rhodospirillum rubrum]CAA39061.1 ORF2 [Rhodospirillum rubrum]